MDAVVGEALLSRGELLDALPAAAYVCDRHGVIRQYNAAAARLWGREPKRGDTVQLFCGSAKLRFPDGTPLPHDRTPMAAVVRGESPEVSGQEVVIDRADGSSVIVAVNIKPVRDTAGRIVGAINCFYDITDRKRAEEARLRSEGRLSMIADNLPALISYVNRDHRYEFNNLAYEAWVGRSRDELTGKHVREILGEDVYRQRLPYLEAALRGESVRFEGPSGSTNSAIPEAEITYVPDVVNGEVRGIFVMGQDISDRKRFERALKQSEERYRAFVTQSSEGIYCWELAVTIDPAMSPEQQMQIFFDHARMAECNDAMARMYGLERADQLVGARPGDLLVPGDVTNEHTLREFVRRGYQLSAVETVERDHAGNTKIFLNNIFGILEGGRLVRIWGTQQDVTDHKKAEEELRLAKQQAEAASAAKDQFLAVLSHELRTPLTPVVMAVAAMEMDPSLGAQVRQDLGMIRRNIELETKLIDDLLDVTRIGNGKLRLQMAPTGVHALLSHVIDICRAEIAAKKLDLRIELEAPRDHVVADAARLQQVFWNLVKNAVKFTPQGGTIHLRTSECDRGKAVCVEVIDSGIGIEPDALGGIFNAFEQGNHSITRQFGGLGLGLTISKALVELHGGSIRAESEGKGCGSTFTLVLPLTSGTERQTAGGMPESRQQTSPDVRVLLAEDHQDTSRILGRLLQGMGYAVETAGSVTAALHLAERQRFDVLISDIGLPDASGLELMRELKRRHGMSGIAVSGFGMDADLKASQEAGFAAHLTKPIDVRQLEVLVRQLAAERGSAHAGNDDDDDVAVPAGDNVI